MEEADRADNISIINEGKIVVTGTPNQLKEKYSTDSLRIMSKNGKEKIEQVLNQLKLEYEFLVDQYIIEIKDTMQALEILPKIKDYIKNFEVLKGNMDSVFLNVTGENLEDNYNGQS
jgi:multidrug/hemolysin transport system ATP-binding protein